MAAPARERTAPLVAPRSPGVRGGVERPPPTGKVESWFPLYGPGTRAGRVVLRVGKSFPPYLVKGKVESYFPPVTGAGCRPRRQRPVGGLFPPVFAPGAGAGQDAPPATRGPRPTAGVETPPLPALAAAQRPSARPQAPPGTPPQAPPRQRHPRRVDAAGGDARGGAASGWRHPPGSAPPPWSRRVRRVSGGGLNAPRPRGK